MKLKFNNSYFFILVAFLLVGYLIQYIIKRCPVIEGLHDGRYHCPKHSWCAFDQWGGPGECYTQEECERARRDNKHFLPSPPDCKGEECHRGELGRPGGFAGGFEEEEEEFGGDGL